MKKALIIKVNENGMEVNSVPFSKGTLDFYYKELECECIDIVHAYGLSIPADIIVDDEGLFKEQVFMNPFASMAYGFKEHGQPIVGNAIICKPHQTPDGIDETGFEPLEIEEIMAEITKQMMEVMK